MRHLDEGTIHAWLDGALDAADAAWAEAHVATCAECAARVAEARGLVAASSRILAALDNVPSGVIPAREHRRGPWLRRVSYAAAAVLLVGVTSVIVEQGSHRAALSAPDVVNVELREAAPMAVHALDSAAAPAAESQAASPAPRVTAPPRGAGVSTRRSGSRIVSTPARDEGNEGGAGTAQGFAGPVASADSARVGQRSMRAENDVAAQSLRPLAELLSRQDSVPVGQMAQNKVVAGVAASVGATAEKDLRSSVPRLVVRDTVAASPGVIVRSTYEVRPGVVVTLMDEPAVSVMQERASAADGRLRTVAPPSAPVSTDAVARVSPTRTITWIDRGRRYTLTGPLTDAELVALKGKLP